MVGVHWGMMVGIDAFVAVVVVLVLVVRLQQI